MRGNALVWSEARDRRKPKRRSALHQSWNRVNRPLSRTVASYEIVGELPRGGCLNSRKGVFHLFRPVAPLTLVRGRQWLSTKRQCSSTHTLASARAAWNTCANTSAHHLAANPEWCLISILDSRWGSVIRPPSGEIARRSSLQRLTR